MNPIRLSIYIGIGLMIASIIVFNIWEPNWLTHLNNKKKKVINQGKLVSLSIVIGILGSIIVFITTMTQTKDIPIISIPKEEPTMKFSNKIYPSF